MFAFAYPILPKKTERMIFFRRLMTAVLVLGIGLRVLALLPTVDGFGISSGSNAEVLAHHSHAMTIPEPAESAMAPASDCHEHPAPNPQLTDQSSPSKSKVCQIFCDMASAPPLLSIPATVVHQGTDVLNPVVNALARSIIPSLDHPPPIAT